MKNDSTTYELETGNVWSFDMGTGSLGECIRNLDDIKHLQSNLFPANFAEIKTAAGIRRQKRTRDAHKAREAWLDSCFKEFDLETLQRKTVSKTDNSWDISQKADERLEREFPAKNDDTYYNSIGLRCKLLLGEKLEVWQLYKALNSAIQLRGYDASDLAWKKSDSKKNDSGEESESLSKFKNELDKMPCDEKYKLPAFFKAWKMGIWNPEKPNEVKNKINCTSQRAAGYTLPRQLVEKEFIALIDNASIQYPALKNKSMYILYGPSEKAYASYYPNLRKEFSLKQGATTDWQGVLGQKIPRFDNRIIDKCSLIPRLNVCAIKSVADSKTENDFLYHDITLMMKLLNMRFLRLSDNTISELSYEEFLTAYEIGKKQSYKFTKTQWKKFLKSIAASEMPNHEEVEEPRKSGRASLSRPAMRLMKELLLSGKSPKDFYNIKKSEIKNTDIKKGLVEKDLDFLKFLEDISWTGIYLPDMKNIAKLNISAEEKDSVITKFIGQQNDPIVRHRLFYFYIRLKFLEQKYGTPYRVILEFVRDDFLGATKKKELSLAMSKNRKEREQSAKELDAENITGGNKILTKYMLLKAQKGVCIYTGEALSTTSLDSYEVDHIVPRSKGGSDSKFNYILTSRKSNSEKADRTPAEWLKNSNKWQAYLDRVKSCFASLGKRRVSLLTSDNAYELIDKYTSLAETAWIAKLVQTVVSMYFGWNIGIHENKRKVLVVSGNTTAMFRGMYKLNKILLPEDFKDEDSKNLSYTNKLQLKNEIDKKNRGNKKHHCLDALAISYAPEFMKALKKRGSINFGKNVGLDPYNFFKENVDKVCPRYVAFEKSKLEETIYGSRNLGIETVMTVKRMLKDLAYKNVNMKSVYAGKDYIEKSAKKILDKTLQNRVIEFSKVDPSEEDWISWCDSLYVINKDGTNGARIIKTRFITGEPTEYKEMSKDKTGSWRKGASHQGQIVWKTKNGKYLVEPIYAHSSKNELIEKLKSREDFDSIVDIFKSGCLIKLDSDVIDSKGEIKAKKGIYILNTILADGRAQFTSQNGLKTKTPIALNYLIKAGFRVYTPDKE